MNIGVGESGRILIILQLYENFSHKFFSKFRQNFKLTIHADILKGVFSFQDHKLKIIS